ncbi:Putative deoxyribonuclease RhsC (DNase RhsC) (Toxin RhsC), partial [Durusdinium trenchii]
FDTYVHVELTGATNATLASSEEKATGLILDDDGRTDDDGHTVEERCDGACAVVNHGVDPHLGSVKADDQNGVGSDGEDNPHPIITVEAVVPPTPSPPGATEPYALFAAQATLSFGLLSSPGGGQLSLNNSTAVYFSETGLDSGEHLRFSVQGDATGIPTGTYDWRMRVTFYYGPESTDPSTINPYNPDLQGLQERHVTFYGSESIVNREGSPFGKRNWHNEIDYISEHFDFLTTGSAAGSTPSSDSGSSEGVTLVLGTGETIYFAAEREDDGPPPTVEEGGIVLPDLTPAKLVAPEGFFGKIRKHSAGGFEIIYPDGSYDLGAFGRWMVTAKYDRFGNKTEFMYNDANADGNVDDVTGITDPFGVTTNFIYNGGKLTKIVDHVGRETLYEIDANNLLTRITTPDPDGAAGPEKAIVTAFEYNTTGNYLTKVRENAQLDTMGQITDAVDTTYVYNSGAIGRVGTIINDDSSSRQIKASQLFALGNPVGAVLPSPFFFATDEIQGEMTNELGEKTTYIVDRYGLMTSVTDNLGNTTEYDRNSDGQIDGVTLPDPDLTDLGNGPRQASSFTYIWDDDDNDINTGSLEQLIYPDSTSEIWEYDETFNQVTRYVDQEGRETLYTLGSNGRVDEIRQVMGVDDRTSSETDDSVWTFTYTQLGDQGHNDVLPIGLVRTITDPDGRITRYRYYGDSGSYNLPKLGLVYRVWEGYNTVDSAYKTFDYYSSRQLKTVTDELGRVTQYEWDDLDRLVKVTLPDPDDDELTDNQPVWEFNYCGCSGQLKTTTDPEGLVTTRHYDGRNRLQKVSVPNPEGGADLEWEYVYDAANRLTKIVDPLERETEYFYDDAGRLDRMLEPDVDGDPMTTNDRPEWIYTLDNLGLVTAIQDPEGRVTDQEYDIRLRLTKVILPQPELGQSRPEWEYEYSDANELRKIFDPLNHVTEYVYDDLGRLITVHLPDPNPGVSGDQPSLNYFYDKAGNLTSVIDGEQNETLYDYDARNRLKSVTLPEPDVGAPKPQMQYVYDDANQLDYMVDPEGRTTDYVYDNLGRVIEEWLDDPDGDPLTDDRPVTYFKYDKLGNLLFVEDALRNTGTSSFVTEYQYDGLHRLIKQIDADAGETVYNYDAVGNLESLTDPELNTTTWLYDGLNRVTSETNELSLQRSYVYDLVGNLQEYTDRRGLVTEYDYDNLDRLTEERWLDQGVTVHTINYGFDLANRMTSGGDTVASYSYAHDNLDRVTGVTSTLAGLTPAVVLAQEWDRANNRTQLGATVGGTADLVNDYVYDGINRLTQVTQQGVGGGNSVEEKRVDFFYNLAGQFDEIHRYADLAGTKSVIDSEFEYDLAGRLASITHGQGALSFAHEFDYDRANRITRHEYFSGGSLADAWDYVYDDRDQLTQVLDGLTVLEDYDYDANGNRDAVDGVAWQNTANNQLYRDATYEYEYDDEGNRTKRILLVAGQPTGATEEYTWDHRNRLTAVTFKTSPTGATTGTIIYAYDVFDRKVRRDEDNNGDGIADTREYYVYDGDDVLIDFYDADANGVLGQTIIARYLHGPGVDQILAQENVGASETYWHLGDHLQTTRDIVRYDEATSQTVAVEHLDYDAFGNVLTASTITRYMFTAREFDADTGLQYNRARWYDSKTGRWISEDPIGFAAGDANLIRYTGNQPTARTDPSGLDWLDAGADFSAGLGDTMSLGLGWLVRDKLIGINTVDYDSGGYYWGGWTGIAVDICSGGIFVKGSLKAAGRTAVREGAEFTAREVTEAGAREVTEQAVKEFAELLRTKSITELKEYTRGLPWQDLWGHGIDGAQTALRRLRSGESICPNSIEREALQAYDEMARRVLADPDKATEVGKRLQELRRAIIEELTRRGL